jgi:hypothetical protein
MPVIAAITVAPPDGITVGSTDIIAAGATTWRSRPSLGR